MSRRLARAVEINDLRGLAKKRLPRAFFDSVDHGSEDDIGIRHNLEHLAKIKLIPRVVRDVSQRDASTTLFGVRHDLPLVIAPTGIAGWASYRGETALARAAAKAKIPFTLSGVSSTPLEKVVEDSGGSLWFHALIWKNPETTMAIIDRVERAGFEALVLTVDSAVPYNRPHDQRNQLTFPMKIRPNNLLEAVRHPRWTFGTATRYILADGHLPRFINVPTPSGLGADELKRFLAKEDALDWSHVRRIRDRWPRTLIVKGILHPADAIAAVEAGADGIVVSNHGGGVLDAAPAPLEMLPEIVAAVGDCATIMVDSGFRRGSDILKAIALGADAVLVGRATFFGLAAAGEAGVDHALTILSNEIRRTMGALGVPDIASLSRDFVRLPGESGVAAHLDGMVGAPLRNR